MTLPHLPAAELAVLELLWQRPGASIRELADALYPGGSTSDYATVQKLIERLEQKHCVRCDRSAFAHRFTAGIARADLIDGQLRDVAQRLCEGSLAPLLMHLVEGATLSKKERDQLRQMLDSGATPSKRRRKQ